ncbi:hypothetical protein [Acutalibacter sp. JLR.KK004]|uniref:hypothetical protein n=1 Tax=Acutalibacter sp. JLR.KK004 TaxID=3112622 RepID=UPI002FF2A0F4
MRKNGKYRFTLQFPAETEEQIRAGELLERLGNRKSAVIIAALDEYLQAHPALQNPKCKVEVNATYNIQPGDIERMVRELVQAQLGQTKASDKVVPLQENTDVNEMLDNLDLFQ